MSVDLNERYVVDETGNRVAVLIDIEEYHKVLEALEELESINAYDEAKAAGDEVISLDQGSEHSSSGYTDGCVPSCARLLGIQSS